MEMHSYKSFIAWRIFENYLKQVTDGSKSVQRCSKHILYSTKKKKKYSIEIVAFTLEICEKLFIIQIRIKRSLQNCRQITECLLYLFLSKLPYRINSHFRNHEMLQFEHVQWEKYLLILVYSVLNIGCNFKDLSYFVPYLLEDLLKLIKRILI